MEKGNVSFNDTLNTFYLYDIQIYSKGPLQKKKKPTDVTSWAILSD